MLISLLSGLVIGILLAIPPGPVGITAIKLSIFKGKQSGTDLAIGNAIVDFLLCTIAVYATSAFISIVNQFSQAHPYLVLLFQALVVFTFVVLGYVNIRTKLINFDYDPTNVTLFKFKFFEKLACKGPLILGIAIALSNLANPTFFPTLTWVSIQAFQHNFIQGGAISGLIFAFGFGLGNFIWIFTLVNVMAKYKHRLSNVTLLRIKQFAGVTFLSFGTLLGYRLLTMTKWYEVLRFAFAF